MFAFLPNISWRHQMCGDGGLLGQHRCFERSKRRCTELVSLKLERFRHESNIGLQPSEIYDVPPTNMHNLFSSCLFFGYVLLYFLFIQQISGTAATPVCAKLRECWQKGASFASQGAGLPQMQIKVTRTTTTMKGTE